MANIVEQRKSIGVVLFREGEGKRKYLLLHYAAGHWDFPKGGVEESESEGETLKRELREETGITEAKVVPGFNSEISYFFREQGNLIRKTVVFHLAETNQKDVTLSFEHKAFEWLPCAEAKERLTHKNAREVLEKAEAFLNQNKLRL